MESVRYKPLTPDDVGPNAYEDGSTSVESVLEIGKVLVYPVPADNNIHLKMIDIQINKLKLLDLSGQNLLSIDVRHPERGLSFDTSKLMNGIYILELLGEKGVRQLQKIVVQH